MNMQYIQFVRTLPSTNQCSIDRLINQSINQSIKTHLY